MSKRRRGGVLEDLLEIGSKIPWQAAVGAALVSFLLLHALAGLDVGTPTDTKDFGSTVARQMCRMVGVIGQFVVPFALLAGAFVGFLKRRRRTELVQDVAVSNSASILNSMTWQEFESLVEEAFRLRGYTVIRLGGDGPDGGVDLELRKGTETVLVQCKHWRAYKVSVQVVRELYGVMAARGAASGIVVTSGTFTRDAVEFASGRNVRLIAGEELRELVRQVRREKSEAFGQAKPPVAQSAPAPTSACPVCGSSMVRRQAKRGANAGGHFFGCSRYPACKGTRAA